MEASDAEGAVWRGFVSVWWDRFGTAEVGAGDLYELALTAEPPLPLGPGNDRSQRTRLGRALGRMRDRVFDIDGVKIRIQVLGVSHQAKRWQLTLEGERGERISSLSAAEKGERAGSEGNVVNERSPAYPLENKGSGERGERGERFSMLTHARARAYVTEDTGQRSPRSPRSQTNENSEGYVGERGGERLGQRSHVPHPPDWLREVL